MVLQPEFEKTAVWQTMLVGTQFAQRPMRPSHAVRSQLGCRLRGNVANALRTQAPASAKARLTSSPVDTVDAHNPGIVTSDEKMPEHHHALGAAEAAGYYNRVDASPDRFQAQPEFGNTCA